MKRILAAAALAGFLAAPMAVQAAMGSDMSCADFNAMDSKGQMEAMNAMKSDGMKADGMKADGMKADAMKSDGMKADGMKSDAMKSDAMGSDVAMACKEHPDMMLKDAMGKSMPK